jgi:hypothetical protein
MKRNQPVIYWAKLPWERQLAKFLFAIQLQLISFNYVSLQFMRAQVAKQ